MSTSRQILLNIEVNEETGEFIQRALVNSRIQFQIESKEPLKIRLPATINVLSNIIAILEEKTSLIQGQVILPSGQSFDVDEKGIKDLKNELIQALSKPQATQIAPTQPTTNWIVEVLSLSLQNPEATSKLVRELSTAIKGDPQALITETKQVTHVSLLILGILGGVIAATSILAGLGKISGDATGFIFGTVLGSAFTFLQRYLTL
jgi:hypothetical protein